MTDETRAIEPYEESKLAPAGSLRASLRPLVAVAAQTAVETMQRAPELADEVVGLVRALRLYWQRRADRIQND